MIFLKETDTSQVCEVKYKLIDKLQQKLEMNQRKT